jgi:23S rRNA pseudoU1915 N3-methylase RlmH
MGSWRRLLNLNRQLVASVQAIKKSGVSKVYFNELPKEVQERFHYDPQKAAAASAEQASSIQQENQPIEEANKQREKEKQVALESSRRATEEAAKAQNTTIEPGNKTATGRHVVGVGGVNGLKSKCPGRSFS